VGEASAADCRAGEEKPQTRGASTPTAQRPLPGILLHLDGSSPAWFQDQRRYDLLVILDDATSEI
jgi:hypothetical protein